MKCKFCGSKQIVAIGVQDNSKYTKMSTSLNLNPLKPFTLFNHKSKVKQKKSFGKIALGVMTGGMSLAVTGVGKNNKTQLMCQNCGHTFKR